MGDSMLTYAELRRGLVRLEVKFSDQEFDRLCTRLDADTTGYVDYGVFARYMEGSELQNRGHHATTGLGATAGGQLAAQRQEKQAQSEMQERGAHKILSEEEQQDVKLQKEIYEKARVKATNLNKLFAQFDDNH